MNKPVFPRFIPILFLALASVMPASGQTQRTVEELYTEVIGYIDTRTNEFTAKGKKPSRDDQDSFQKEQSHLAAKYAAKIAAYPNLSNQDLAYLGLLYDLAEDEDRGLETYRRFLSQLSPDATGNAVQIARSRVVVYAARKKLIDEMEKAYEAWLRAALPNRRCAPRLKAAWLSLISRRKITSRRSNTAEARLRRSKTLKPRPGMREA